MYKSSFTKDYHNVMDTSEQKMAIALKLLHLIIIMIMMIRIRMMIFEN